MLASKLLVKAGALLMLKRLSSALVVRFNERAASAAFLLPTKLSRLIKLDMTHALKHYLKHFLFYLGGDQPTVSWVERLRSVLGAFLGLMLVLTIANTLVNLQV